jgi:hypothetical protein
MHTLLCFALLSSHFQVKPTHSLHTTTDKLSRHAYTLPCPAHTCTRWGVAGGVAASEPAMVLRGSGAEIQVVALPSAGRRVTVTMATGPGPGPRHGHKLDSEGDRTITPNSLRCSLASMLDRRAPMSPWRPTTERADRFSRSTSSASGTYRWLRSNPLLPVTRRTTCDTSHESRQSVLLLVF